jgi:P4 family phage/plasmid primase-like protien
VKIYPDQIAPEVKRLDTLLLWKYFKKPDGKLIKSPVSETGVRMGYNDPYVLMPFEYAKERLSKGNDLGIGISLLDGIEVSVGDDSGYLWCLDFDGFVNPDSTQFDDGVNDFISTFNSYAEISPSGTGFKFFFVCDRKPQSKFKIKFGPSEFFEEYPNITKYEQREIEVFSCNGFLALTGDLFDSLTGGIKFLSATELDSMLERLNNWAIDTGGTGTTMSVDFTNSVTSSSTNTSYSRLIKSSLEDVLAHVDHFDEQAWTDTCNVLARVYGQEGRPYFHSYSSGEYAGITYADYNCDECNRRYDRALNELKGKPDGYGIKYLVETARKHPDWNDSKLVYESIFDFSDLSQANSVVGSQTPYSLGESIEELPSNIDRMDIRNGERFREHFLGTILFVRDTNYVLCFDPARGWTKGNSDLPMQSAKAVVAKMTEVCAEAIADGKEVGSMLADVKRSSSRRALEDMIKLASSEPEMSVALSALDNNPYLLGVKNGVVDLRAGSLLSPNPKLLVTKYCDIEFDSQAKCPQFCAFLEQVVPIEEQRDFLVIVLGYFLTGLSNEQLWFFFHGVGSNGKSVLITLLENLMGDYATKIPTEMLMQHNRTSAGPAPDLLLLQGKRLVFCNETKEGQRLDDARLKDLTGGDTIIARPLYSNNHISFSPTHKLVVVGNYHPTVSDDSHGFWRRVVLYPFSVTIPQGQQDKGLLEKLISEGPGILNYLLKALKIYFANGLEMPKTLSKATQKYRTEQDVVQQFLDDECVTAPEKTIPKSTLYSKYTLWCSVNGLYGVSSNRLSRKLKAKGFKLREDKRTWIGVGALH